MEFEWDENKRISNLVKHRIDFIDATLVFRDPRRLNNRDTTKDYGETRINTIGELKDGVIVAVIHTDRQGVIRIISARRASRKERKLYYGNR
ncbi:MAG: BrnT family toxin [Dysgonamonadaceae bacterium]|jgi:uncharacterized DUF497 family protein|nr:BrnT family toxin [Dysgonamonadaceae bacterium]